MELNLTKDNITVMTTLMDNLSEVSIQNDFTLPDYLPDIQKILSCTITPKIITKTIGEEKISIDANCYLKVVYLCAQGELSCFENKIPFNKTLSADTSEPIFLDVTLKTDYSNAKAINSRKIEVKGSISVAVLATIQQNEELICNVDNPSIMQKKDLVHYSLITSDVSEMFQTKEMLSLPNSKPSIASIICSSASCNLSDFRLINNKVVVKGEILLHMLYTNNENVETSEKMDYNIPFNQIIDAVGVTEDSQCSIVIDVNNYDLSAKSDDDGDMRDLIFEANLYAQIKAYKSCEFCTVIDAYSTKCEELLSKKTITYHSLNSISRENIVLKDTISLPENVHAVVDMWSTPCVKSYSFDNNNLKIDCLFDINILALDGEGSYLWCEQKSSLSYELPIDNLCCDSSSFLLNNLSINICSSSFTLNNVDNIDVRIDSTLCYTLSQKCTSAVIEDITVDEEKQKLLDKEIAMTIYYPCEGESVWTIAKKFNTSSEIIMQENSLDSDITTSSPLIISAL